MATTYYSTWLSRSARAPQTVEQIPIDFVVTTELAAGDLVHLAKIPANKRVVGGYLEIAAGGHAATGTLGDGTTADLFGSLTSMELARFHGYLSVEA